MAIISKKNLSNYWHIFFRHFDIENIMKKVEIDGTKISVKGGCNCCAEAGPSLHKPRSNVFRLKHQLLQFPDADYSFSLGGCQIA
jgi:hypothetical protein